MYSDFKINWRFGLQSIDLGRIAEGRAIKLLYSNQLHNEGFDFLGFDYQRLNEFISILQNGKDKNIVNPLGLEKSKFLIKEEPWKVYIKENNKQKSVRQEEYSQSTNIIGGTKNESDKDKSKKELRNLVIEGQAKIVGEYLKERFPENNEIIIMLGKQRDLERDIRMKIMSREEARREKSTLKLSWLGLIDVIMEDF